MSQRLDGRNLVELFAARVQKSGPKTALRHKQDGRWVDITWQSWQADAERLAGGLLVLGVSPGERVGILAQSRWEWAVADLAIATVAAVSVPIYPSSTADQCQFIVGDSTSRVLLVDDPLQLAKMLPGWSKLPELKAIVLMSDVAVFDRPDEQGRTRLTMAEALMGHTPPGRVVTWEALLAEGAARKAELPALWQGLTESDLFTIVYTSGTTGNPKGVVLTHGNVLFQVNTIGEETVPVGEDDEQLSFLPLAHIFARALEWLAVKRGYRTAFAESTAKLLENLLEVQPTFLAAVPRVYEKVYAKVQAGFDAKRKTTAGRLVIDWAVRVGQARAAARAENRAVGPLLALSARVVDALVWSKVRAVFGGRCRLFISGGAPLAGEIAQFLLAADLLVLEGYGLTETTAPTHFNQYKNFRFGTVGIPMNGMEMKIEKDGEIVVRGPNVFKEYWNKPEATREVLTEDGWFHTGDIGVVEEGNFLRITDRKKDLIVTAGGKNVAPQNLENAFKTRCPLVSQVVVFGDRRPYLVALVTLNEDNLRAFVLDQGLTAKDATECATLGPVRAVVEEALASLNRELPSYETIKKFHILPQDLSEATGELTPSLKVKRKVIAERYADLVNALYG